MSTVEELPSPNMGAFYKNEDQTLYIKRDIGNSVALCQCVAQELGHAQLAMNCEAYSRRDMASLPYALAICSAASSEWM